MTRKILCLCLIGCFLAAAGGLRAEDPQPGKQVAQSTKVTIGNGDQAKEEEVRYWLYLPENYDQQEKVPMMLFLHGAGERGDDLDRVKVHGPPKLIDQGKSMPFLVVSPQCPTGTWWQTDRLLALVDHIQKTYKVDLDRTYVTGLSMGGYGSWALAAEAPERWAAVVPICGGGDPKTAETIKGLPFWVFHGEKDNVVSIDLSRKMVDALNELGAEVKFTTYPEAGHDSWTETYNNPELYEWMLSKERGK